MSNGLPTTASCCPRSVKQMLPLYGGLSLAGLLITGPLLLLAYGTARGADLWLFSPLSVMAFAVPVLLFGALVISHVSVTRPRWGVSEGRVMMDGEALESRLVEVGRFTNVYNSAHSAAAGDSSGNRGFYIYITDADTYRHRRYWVGTGHYGRGVDLFYPCIRQLVDGRESENLQYELMKVGLGVAIASMVFAFPILVWVTS
jgi:hypothetical protein